MIAGRPRSMVVRALLGGALALATVAGCGGDDEGETTSASTDVGGTYVGEAKGTDALVAIVAPPAEDDEGLELDVYVCDADRVCASLPAPLGEGSFEASSGSADAKVSGDLSEGTFTGEVELPGGKTARYRAERATGAAGVYDLTISGGGKLSGASESGVALRGVSTLPEPGDGALKLADGTRLDFEATEDPAAEAMSLQPDRARLIVMPSGELRGAASGGGAAYLFLR